MRPHYPVQDGKSLDTRVSSFAFALIVLLSTLAWTGCSRSEPYDWDEVDSATPAPTPLPSPPTRPTLVVYLDTSASMAGYVTPDGQNVFGAALRTLRDVVTSFRNPLEVSVRSVDASVRAPDPDGALALQKASINMGLYRGGETDLAGAIASFDPSRTRDGAQADGIGSADAAQPEPVERFHVLITDGVQSKKAQDTKQACLKGSDSTCVREKIIHLLKKGWGAYVIGLRSQFHGTVYSEVNPSLRVQYDTSDSNPKRFRPFYLYIFSPDRTALDEFVAGLRERLRTVAPAETMRVLALTSPYTERTQKAEVTIPEASDDAVEIYEQLDEPARLALEVNQDVDEAAPLSVEVAVEVPWSQHVRDSGTPQELSSLLRWQVVPVKPAEGGGTAEGVRYAVVKADPKSRLDGQGRVVVRLTAGWPRTTAEPAWRAYALRGYLELGMGHEPLPWIRHWSTDLDINIEQADRTLNLESVLTGLWRNPVLEEQVVAEVFLQVGPQ